LGIYSNQITALESGIFNGLLALTELELQHNQISSIENGTFNGLPDLHWLDLSHNSITSLDPDTFSGLGLQTLYLDSNFLISLPETFIGLTSITNGALYIDNNKFCA
jgi:Leucine-rich repeat (LRR) protein